MASESPRLLRLDEQLAHWAAVRPGHRALVAPSGSLTFRQLLERSHELAAQLSALGVRARDVVAFQLPNILDAFALYYAVVGMDAVVLPILPAMREHDLSYMLRESRAALFVTLASWRGVDHEVLARKSCSAATPVALIEPGAGLRIVGKGERAMEPSDAPVLPATAGGLDAICSMIFTSGTSGRPKAVTYSHRNLGVEGRDMAGVDRISADDVLFTPPAIAHVSGICFGLYMPMAAGSTVCLMPEWNPELAVRTIEKERCTWTAGATPFLQGIVDAAERDASTVQSLRVFRCGGASVPPALVRRARELGIDAYRSYGMSEHPTISGRAGQSADECMYSDGVLHPLIDMIVVDPANPARRLRAGEAGEIAVRGPDQSVGYLRASDTEAGRIDGWLLTGDIGTLSESRVVTITGRKKDIIIRKGENIAARELEDLISDIPQVKDVAVVGVADAERGEMVCCVAVVHPGQELSLPEVCQHLRAAGLSAFKLPERLECVDALPYNAGGKVLKTEIRRMLATRDA
jgi:cyclohexanecarboxylate-CoA ligase